MAASKPTFQLSLGRSSFVFTLSWNLGPLTLRTVVSARDYRLTPQPRLPSSTEKPDSEFERKVTPFGAALPNQCSTPASSSEDAVLRYISKGTRYCQVRLDFHPYTQVTQAEYTSTGCGPPPTCKSASPCSCVDHIGFGSLGSD